MLFTLNIFFFVKEESECVLDKNKRRRLENENDENPAGNRTDSEPVIAIESPTEPHSPDSKRSRINEDAEESSAGIRTEPDHEPITIESPGPMPTRSQEDVMIVGDVQVARPEVIDLERLPTIRQGTCILYNLSSRYMCGGGKHVLLSICSSPGARFSKDLITYWARKAIFNDLYLKKSSV